MYSKTKPGSSYFLPLFLLAVDPQIMIYMEEWHTMDLLYEHSGESNNQKVHCDYQCLRHNGRA